VLEITVVPWQRREVTFGKNFRERKSAYGFHSLCGAVFDSFVDRIRIRDIDLECGRKPT
jgi:hypothetical protein